MDTKIEVKPNKEGNLTITQLTGAALPLKPKVKVEMRGTIESVLDFCTKRESEIEQHTAHVVINRKSRSVVFTANENDEIYYRVTGTMILHEYIEQLGINDGKKNFSIQELINLFKLNRRFFTSREHHANIVKALTNFQAKTEIEFTNSNDYKGSVANQKIVKVKHDIPLGFEMKIPVFEGQEPSKFNVDIEVYPENGSLVCAFVSVELAELIETSIEGIFTKVKSDLAKYVQIVQ